MAMLGFYRLDENGRTLYGPGDADAVSVLRRRRDRRHGAQASPSRERRRSAIKPTGFGMGHVMVMPSVWLARIVGRMTLRADGRLRPRAHQPRRSTITGRGRSSSR